jgi:DNA-binding NarL/FixJ family response regulator
VILDIAMPKLNGLEAAAQIRLIAPESTVVFVSQNTDAETIDAALQDGAAAYVRKSALDRDLVPAIETALGGNRFVSADLRFQL